MGKLPVVFSRTGAHSATPATNQSDLRTQATTLARAFGRDEEGSFLIFSLFLFIGILIIGGMAVDLMRFETERVEMQNTIDSAVLAAADIEQTIDAETLIKDFAEKSGIDPDLITVPEPEVVMAGADPDNGVDGTLVGRTVRASGDLDMNTYFMKLMGIDELRSASAATANEGVQNVEISLIVDISGSMDGTKMTTLKTEAKKFFRKVIDETRTAGHTSISIIPYNHTVVAGPELLSRLNAGGATLNVETPRPYPGALLNYPSTHSFSNCIRFPDSMFLWTDEDDLEANYASLRAIVPPGVDAFGAATAGTPLTRVAHFDRGDNSYNEPEWSDRECDETRTSILVHETRIAQLDAHINLLKADGWTAIENGMKWGVALLDPAMRPVVNDMVDAGLVQSKVENRPGDYDIAQTMKVVVLMTDGENTSQRGLKAPFVNGPSRVWFSAKAADKNEASFPVTDENGNVLARDKEWFDGYFVEMPNWSEDMRFVRVHEPGVNGDRVKYGVTEVPDDLVQLHNITLYERFAEEDIANFFFDGLDNTVRDAYRDSVENVVTADDADLRLDDLCEAAKRNGDITVFSIAFSAPQRGQDAMQGCATSIGFYYNATPENLVNAFDSIAGAISQLRLTQ
ncbi:MAG: pilus assembly protein TadG-related protein [Pseudomonadota bacterium]